ncbi:MAG: nucleoside hydrolase [Anaerolineaceae bacterium]|nr:nucleoside hydrolase [Anaerolineaceae bacterium]
MRRLLIDTDTASDDAVALIMALRDATVQVEAITVVAGNVPLDLAVKNALISVEMAGTYAPPVYRGVTKPFLRDLFTSEFVHGEDGMGNMNLPEPRSQAAAGHASDVIIALARQYPHELEIVTLGPLSNLALACLKAPDIAGLVKSVFIMGGCGLGPGNITPVAEFNIFVDAEAAQIVANSGLPLTFVGWDVSTDDTFITQADIDALLATGSKIAAFCVRCNAVLQQYNADSWGKIGFDLPDPVTMAAALYPDIITRQIDAYVHVEYRSEACYGQVVIDQHNLLQRPANACICLGVDARRFKEILFRLVQ